MLKLIFTGLLVYFVYRFFLAPPVIDREEGRSKNSNNSQNSNDKNYEDDYIDYEEVD